MNVKQTKEFFEENNIVAVKADKGNENQIDEIEALLIELGNPKAAIPFYAIYGPGLDKPITADALITQNWVYESLKKAKGESASADKSASLPAGDVESGKVGKAKAAVVLGAQ